MSILQKDTQFPGSEDEILSCIARYFPNNTPSTILGRGDDCALFHVEQSSVQ